jgi:hypothetical protein
MLLRACIELVESSRYPHAIRFEATLWAKDPQWVNGQEPTIARYNGGCSQDTARMIACSSWGLYQLLGANIYALGYQNSIIEFCGGQFAGLNISDQCLIFDKFISRNGFKPDEDLSAWRLDRFEQFAAFYNGPGDVQNYASHMRALAHD